MAGAVVLIVLVPPLREFYALATLSGQVLVETAVVALAGMVGIEVVWQVTRRGIARRHPEYAAEVAAAR